jgi:hypothetical protein
MIMRRAVLGAGMDVREDAEFQLRILIEAFARVLVVRPEVPRDERVIHQYLFEQVANFSPAGGAWLRLQQVVAPLAEFLNCPSHWISSQLLVVPSLEVTLEHSIPLIWNNLRVDAPTAVRPLDRLSES